MLPLLKAMGQDRVCVCVYVGGGHRTVPSAQCGLNLQHPLPPSATSTPYGRSLPPPRKKTLQNQQLLFGEMKSTMLNSPWGPFITHTHAPEASNLQKSANPPPPTKVPPKVPRSPERSHRAMAPPAGEPPLTALPLFHLIGQPN